MNRSSSRVPNSSSELSIPTATLVNRAGLFPASVAQLEEADALRARKITCKMSPGKRRTDERSHPAHAHGIPGGTVKCHVFRTKKLSESGLCTIKQTCVACLALEVRLLVLPVGAGTPAVALLCSRKKGSGPPETFCHHLWFSLPFCCSHH